MSTLPIHTGLNSECILMYHFQVCDNLPSAVMNPHSQIIAGLSNVGDIQQNIEIGRTFSYLIVYGK